MENNKERKFREKNILSLFKELNNYNQESIYNLVWSLTAKDLLLKLKKEDGNNKN